MSSATLLRTVCLDTVFLFSDFRAARFDFLLYSLMDSLLRNDTLLYMEDKYDK